MKNLLNSPATIALLVLAASLIILGCGGDEETDKTCDPTCDSTLCQICEGEACVSICSDGQICNAGFCEDPAVCNPECDSGACMTCEEGNCISTCTEGQSCNEGTCEADPPTCDPECDADNCMTCEDGNCVSTCTEDQTCNEGTCEEPPACDPECDADNCMTCMDGTCESLCGESEVCIESSCEEAPECDPECNPDACEACTEGECLSFCEEGQVCEEGECYDGGECGDSTVDVGEDCDSEELDGATCGDLGFDSGELACDDSCQFDTSACEGCNADEFEDNPDEENAAEIEQGIYELTLCADEEDWFVIDVNSGDTLGVEINFLNEVLDIDLALYDTEDTPLDSSTGTSNTEVAHFTPEEDKRVLIKVYGFRSASSSYTMNISLNPDCISHDDCDEESVCVGFECTEGCRDDSFCDEGSICLDFECTEGCRYDEDCTETICIDHICQEGCRDHSDCAEGEACEDNVCFLAECLTSDDCDEGAPCINYECTSCDDDPYEPNDAPEEAAALDMDFYEEDLTLCGTRDTDWYSVELEELTFYEFNIYFSDALGDIDFYLYEESNTESAKVTGGSTSDDENLVYGVPSGAGGTYILKVLLYSEEVQSYTMELITGGDMECSDHSECGDGEICEDYACIEFTCDEENPCPYGLVCNEGTCVDCIEADDCSSSYPEDYACTDFTCVLQCEEDDNEPNTDMESAQEVNIPYVTDDLTLCGSGAEDWLKFELEPDTNYAFVNIHTYSEGNVDIYLYTEDNTDSSINSSTSYTDNENMSYTVPEDGGGIYYLKIKLYTSIAQTYDMAIDTPECLTNGDCEEDQLCVNYECITPECESHSECEIGELCDNYACIEFICDQENTCPMGMQCFDGTCVDCVDETGCPNTEDFSCEDNICVLHCEEDSYEPNNTNEEPAAIDLDFSDSLTLCGHRDSDWFSFELEASRIYNFDLTFLHSEGDVDVALYKADNLISQITSAISSNDNESIIYAVPSDGAGTYYLRVYLFSVYTQAYDLAIVAGDEIECFTHNECEAGEICDNYACVEFNCDEDNACPSGLVCNEGRCVDCLVPTDCDINYPEDFACIEFSCVLQCDEDYNEPNVDPESAKEVIIPYSAEALTLCERNAEDWLKFELEAGTSYGFVNTHTHSEGNIDFYLYAENDTTNSVTYASTYDNNETMSYAVPENGGGIYYLKIRLSSSSAQTYDISIDTVECISNDICDEGEFCVNFICVIPECGNGIVEGDEQCDSNNDSCDACMIITDEEPNDTSDDASEGIVPGVVFGFIETGSDMDWFEFTVEVAGTYTFETTDSSNGFDTVDTQIFLCDNSNPGACNYSTGNLLANDDGGSTPLYSMLSFSLEANTTYYIVVQSFSDRTGYYKLTSSSGL